ncbi:hypothetical protein MTO96_012723 [Rhipicephalus appendiculatus]
MAYELRFHVIQVVLVWLPLMVHSGRPADTFAKQLQFPEDCGFSTDPERLRRYTCASQAIRTVVIVRDINLIKQQKRQQRTSLVQWAWRQHNCGNGLRASLSRYTGRLGLAAAHGSLRKAG